MKKIEKYIIAVITLIAIGAIGTAIYFGMNKTKDDNKEISNAKETVVENENNEISDLALYALGYITKDEMTETIISAMKGDDDYSSEMKRIEYSEICERTYKLILNPDYYEYNSATGLYEDVSNREEIMKLKIENGLDILSKIK